MKRFLSIAVAAFIVFSLTACNRNIGRKQEVTPTVEASMNPAELLTTAPITEAPTINPSVTPTIGTSITGSPTVPSAIKYKNGTYVGFSDKTSTGKIKATIVVRSNKIYSVKFAQIATNGKEKKGTTMEPQVALLQNAIKAQQIVNATISGQETVTVKNCKVAAQRALIKAETSNLRDGQYVGLGDPTSTGNDKATITVKNGKITKVKLMRTDKKGKAVTQQKTKSLLSKLESAVLKNQNYNITNLNDVTINNSKIAIKRAIEKATAKK